MPGYIHEFARIWRNMPKIVFSRSLEKVEWNSRLVREVIAGEVSRLKDQPGKALDVGGTHLAATLVKHNLIDEYQLFVNPVILGGGTPFFPNLDEKIDLRLVETRRFNCGVVLLRYLRENLSKNSAGV